MPDIVPISAILALFAAAGLYIMAGLDYPPGIRDVVVGWFRRAP